MLGRKSTVEINQHIQRHREIMGLKLGLVQKQKHIHTLRHKHTQQPSGNKVCEWINIYFQGTKCSGHTVSGDGKQHNSHSMQPCHESHTNNKARVHRWFHMVRNQLFLSAVGRCWYASVCEKCFKCKAFL